jgi:hypothetical protein
MQTPSWSRLKSPLGFGAFRLLQDCSEHASLACFLRTRTYPVGISPPAEYAHQVSVAQQREYRAACDEHADEREAIRRQVLAEYRAKYGPDFGNSMGGRWAIGHRTLVRFTAYMAERYGIAPP